MFTHAMIFLLLACTLWAVDVDIDIGLDNQLTGQVSHEIHVGRGGAQLFMPNQINANLGDKIVFTFHKDNHTVTQSSLESPCVPLLGFDTGFNNLNPYDQRDVSLTLTVTSLESQWFFCKQNKPLSHCHAGMVFAINPGNDMASFLHKARAGTARDVSSALPWVNPSVGTHPASSLTTDIPDAEAEATTVSGGLSVIPVDPLSLQATSRLIPSYSGSSSPDAAAMISSSAIPWTTGTDDGSSTAVISTSAIPTSTHWAITTDKESTAHTEVPDYTSLSTLASSHSGPDSITSSGSVIAVLPTDQSTVQPTDLATTTFLPQSDGSAAVTTVTVTQTMGCSSVASAMSVRRGTEVVSEGAANIIGSLLGFLGAVIAMIIIL